MEATAERADLRHGAVRVYLDHVMRRIGQAAAIYELHGQTGTPDRDAAFRRIMGHMIEAKRLARGGLPMLAALCGDKLPPGWSEGVIEYIRSIGVRMDVDPSCVGRGTADMEAECDRVLDRFLELSESLPPEEGRPDLAFDAEHGLRECLRPPCRVRMQGEGRRALVDGREIEPALTPRMSRLLGRLADAGDAGLTKDQLGGDRPAVSELLAFEGLRGVIQGPGKRGPRGCPGIYRIKAA